jgi:sugar O-acyltransferase (sialic acid O-acetyltransferase NeuD family)
MKPGRGIVLLGGGGHCEIVIDALRQCRRFMIEGILDPNPDLRSVSGIPVIGDDDCLLKIRSTVCPNAMITVGSVGFPAVRIRIAARLIELGFCCPSVIHPAARVAKTAIIEDGAFIAAGAIVNPYATVDAHAIVNTGSIIEHHCRIGRFVHIAPGAVVCGGVVVGDNTHIGANATVIEGRRIGSNALIGAGAVVVRDVPAGRKAFGNPCALKGRHE